MCQGQPWAQALLCPTQGLPEPAGPWLLAGPREGRSLPSGSHSALSSEPSLGGGPGTAASLASSSAPPSSGAWVTPPAGGTPAAGCTAPHAPSATCLSSPVRCLEGTPGQGASTVGFSPKSQPLLRSRMTMIGAQSAEPTPQHLLPGPDPSRDGETAVTEGQWGEEARTRWSLSRASTWVTGLLGPQGPLRPLLRAAARLPLGLSSSHAGYRHQGDGLALLGREQEGAALSVRAPGRRAPSEWGSQPGGLETSYVKGELARSRRQRPSLKKDQNGQKP